MKNHWTEQSIKDYLFSVGENFIAQLEEKMKNISGMTQGKLAKKLNLSKGRVSQIFNMTGNITLENIIKYSRALGMKVAIVVYEDNDPKNKKGLINPEIFKTCWEKMGKPRDFWAFENQYNNIASTSNIPIKNTISGIFYGSDRIPTLDVSKQMEEAMLISAMIKETANTNNSEIKSLSQV